MAIHKKDAFTQKEQDLAEFAKALVQYLKMGREGLDFTLETTEVLDRLDAARTAGEQHAVITMGGGRRGTK